MRIGDDQLHASQPAGLQRAQEPGPKHLVLTVADIEAEDFAASIGGDTERDHDRLGHHPVTHSGLAVGGVQEHVRVAHGGEVTVPERADFSVEVLADAGHLRFGDAGVGTEGFDEVIDLAGRDTVQVGLHHDGVEGLIDAAAPLEQRREERPQPQLRDVQVQIPGRGRQDPRPGPVALRRAADAAFERGCTDEAVASASMSC